MPKGNGWAAAAIISGTVFSRAAVAHVHELASGGPEQLRVALIESEQQKEVAPDA